MLHAVFDSGSGTLLATGTFPAALILLNESMLDTIYVSMITTDDIQKLRAAPPREYPEWSWHSGNVFRKTNPAIITEEMRERAVFAMKKTEAFAHAIYIINRLRDKIDTGAFAQATIYAQKQEQARMLKAADYDTAAVHAPYIVQYAEDTGITPAQAVDEILFQAQLDNEYLEKTERVRLALFRKLRNATTVKEMETVMFAYHKDGTV